MIVIVPDDFTRSVRIHGPSGDAKDAIAWLEKAIASIAAGDGAFGVHRQLGPDRYGFDEVLTIIETGSEPDKPRARFIIPLIEGWILPGANRPDMGALRSDTAFIAIDRLIVDLKAVQAMPADPVAEVVTNDRASGLMIAALMTCDHPEDGDDELVFEEGDRRLEIHCDRLTGLPYVSMIDRHYSDDAIDPEDRLPPEDLVEICRRHVLALELRRAPDEEHAFGLVRLDREDEHQYGRIHSIVTSPLESLRIVADIRAGGLA